MNNTASGQVSRPVRPRWTTRDKVTHWLLFVLAIVAGLQTGGVIFDTLVNDPVWSDSIEAARTWNEDIDTGRFYMVLTNGLVLLAVATLAVGWRSGAPVRGWLRGATALFIFAVVTTMAYFLPELQEIRGASALSIPDDELWDRIQRWTLLDTVREALVFVGFVLTVRAVGLSHALQARAGFEEHVSVAAAGSSLASRDSLPGVS